MDTKIALLVMTDGRRDYIHKTIASAEAMLKGPIGFNVGPCIMFDDSGSEENHRWLSENFPLFTLVYKETRQGFGGAINSAWDHLKEWDYNFDYVFHLEDDFTFNREIPLEAMAKALDDNPNVYQMALRRQAWNNEEKLAGGIIERWPDQFHQQEGFITHRLFFTTNPSLYRRSLIDTWTYPDVKDAEGHFTLNITSSNPNAVFGYWGNKTDSPWVEHLGVVRKGNRY